jgi:transcriptional regulator of acetoin/glycerol metabolism
LDVEPIGSNEAQARPPRDAANRAPRIAHTSIPGAILALPLPEAREQWTNELEREYVRAILHAHNGNVTAAAQSAGVNRSYIHRLMRKHEL